MFHFFKNLFYNLINTSRLINGRYSLFTKQKNKEKKTIFGLTIFSNNYDQKCNFFYFNFCIEYLRFYQLNYHSYLCHPRV